MIVGVLTTATSFSRCNPMWFLSMGLRQGSGVCSSSSRKYLGTGGTNQNRHWNHHRWHATNSLERTGLSCWCLQNHKGCTYRAPVRYVTKTWSVVLLNKKYILLSQVYCIWQVVKTPTIISNNRVYYDTRPYAVKPGYLLPVPLQTAVLPHKIEYSVPPLKVLYKLHTEFQEDR